MQLVRIIQFERKKGVKNMHANQLATGQEKTKFVLPFFPAKTPRGQVS
jgi:pyoverdine/dityrosine biosynthesis protein Dit1